MNDEKRLRQIEEELKKSSQKIFQPNPHEMEKELEDSKTLGSPDSLFDSDDDTEE